MEFLAIFSSVEFLALKDLFGNDFFKDVAKFLAAWWLVKQTVVKSVNELKLSLQKDFAEFKEIIKDDLKTGEDRMCRLEDNDKSLQFRLERLENKNSKPDDIGRH